MQSFFFFSVLSCCTFFSYVLQAQTEREVTITHWSALEENGYIKVVGELKNTYSNPLMFVRVEIEYFDKSGKPLGVDRFTARDAGTMAKDECSADLEVIFPNEISTFQRVREADKVKEQLGSCKVKAFGMLLKDPMPFQASIKDLKITRNGKDFLIKGSYKATGKQACKNPAIVVAGYDASGKVVKTEKVNFTKGGRYDFIQALSPGEVHNFSINFTNNDKSSIVQVKVFPFFSAYF